MNDQEIEDVLKNWLKAGNVLPLKMGDAERVLKTHSLNISKGKMPIGYTQGDIERVLAFAKLQTTEDISEDCLLSRFYDPTKTTAYNTLHMTNRFYDEYSLHAESTNIKAPVWFYDTSTGIYKQDFADTVRQEVWRVAGEFGNTTLANETINRTRARAYDRNLHLGEINPDKIVVANGVLNLKTRELEEHSPEGYHITALPASYDPDAKCPNFNKFMPQVVPSINGRMNIEEFGGFGFVGDYRFKDLLLLTGPPNSGKSTFLSILGIFYGPENITASSMQALASGQYSIAALRGKIANICPDVPNTRIKDASMLKTLTGMDRIEARMIYGAPFTFLPRAKLWFAANDIPAGPADDAFHDRVTIIDFPNTFTKIKGNRENKADLIASMTTPEELSGILNLFLAGWKRYEEQGELTGSKTTEAKALDYVKRSDPIQYFCQQYIVPNESMEQYIEHKIAYWAYKTMCRVDGSRVTSTSNLSSRFEGIVSYAEPDSHPTTRRKIWRMAQFNAEEFFKEYYLRVNKETQKRIADLLATQTIRGQRSDLSYEEIEQLKEEHQVTAKLQELADAIARGDKK